MIILIECRGDLEILSYIERWDDLGLFSDWLFVSALIDDLMVFDDIHVMVVSYLNQCCSVIVAYWHVYTFTFKFTLSIWMNLLD